MSRRCFTARPHLNPENQPGDPRSDLGSLPSENLHILLHISSGDCHFHVIYQELKFSEGDLKSLDFGHAGSTPAARTTAQRFLPSSAAMSLTLRPALR